MRAINESRRQSVGRAIKKVSAASNWPSAHEVLAGSTGHASKEAQRTDAGNSIITDEQRMLRAVPSPGSTTKTRRIGDQGGGRIWCDRCSSAGKKGCLPDVGALGDPSNQAMTLR